jgi:uncharacterized protein (DUF58 family)
MNLARFNHILIPATWAERQRLQNSLHGRLLMKPTLAGYNAFTSEGRALVVLGLLAGVLGLDVQHTKGHLLWCMITGLLVACLIMRPWFRLRDVEVSVHAPSRVAVDEDVSITVVVRNEGERDLESVRTLYPILPWDGRWTSPRPVARRVPSGGSTQLERTLSFVQRGEHHLSPIGIGNVVPGGLVLARQQYTRDIKLLVVPRIARVDTLSTPMAQRYQPGGVALASKTGESMELMSVRPYRAGDPLRDLHAKTWARTGTPHVREYQQEYFSRVGVILDTESNIVNEDIQEAAISLAAGILAYFTRGEALIDLLVVGDEIHPLTIGRSLGSLEQALDLLAVVEPGTPLDDDRLFSRLNPYLERLSTLVLILLRWDEPRRRLLQRVRDHGVGCRVLLVTNRQDLAKEEATVVRVSPAKIADDRGLRL